MVKLQKKPIKAKSKTKAFEPAKVPQRVRKDGSKMRLKKDVTKPCSFEELEEAYRAKALMEMNNRENVNHLLPIKIKGKGFVSRSATKHTRNDIEIVTSSTGNVSTEGVHCGNDKEQTPPMIQKDISLADILLKREEDIKEKQFYIGTTCSAILENPEERIENVGVLLDFVSDINRAGSVNFLTVRKTAIISLVEVFKDIVPEYRIGIVDKGEQKLKKDTLARVNFESKLLTYYKQLLRYLESITNHYGRNLHKSNKVSIESRQLLETCVQCLCDLVLAHPYFNYSPNIVQVLVLMLNNAKESIRKSVNACFGSLFRTDKRLDLTYHTVRHINMLIKKKQRNVFPEVISCLKYLQIHRISMHDEKMMELKKQKLEKQKSYFINMSRKERKRKKKLHDVENDIFETKTEESKQVVRRKLTEISKLTFMVYFKILKCYPESRVLSVTLEGLAKFAHTINIDFFGDLVELLNNLLENGDLGYREQLHCIQTVFIILSGQGEVLNIDPARFYSHFYKNLLFVNAGKNHEDMETIMKTLDIILFKRRRNVTYHRYVSFVKRLATLCLQVLPNGSLGLLSLIRSCMHMHQQLDILLDTDADIGSGKFDPFNHEPEFSHANSTALFESTCLARHYHPTVRKMITNIMMRADGTYIKSGKTLAPLDFFTGYDSVQMVFNPEILPPTKVHYGKNYSGMLDANTFTHKSLYSPKTSYYVESARNTNRTACLWYDYFIDVNKTCKISK